jgi:UDP-N-acetylglucosamine diphosphorylase/glucosamine-1-phosphate N-acetyltransferase
MRYVLCDPDVREILYPFYQFRKFSELRIGLLTIGERYAKYLGQIIGESYPNAVDDFHVYINAAFIPDAQLVTLLLHLKPNEAITCNNEYAAICVAGKDFAGFACSNYTSLSIQSLADVEKSFHSAYDLLRLNHSLLADDIQHLDLSNAFEALSSNNHIYGSGKLIVEEGAKITGAFLNTDSGPIYIGGNATVMEGAHLRGPVAVLDNAVVKMGAKIYGSTIIGKKCVVGGEIKNSIFFDCSNKAHDGYIGDSVIGSWCNLGAGTSCSNLKNNAGEIHIWNPLLQQKISVGNKCGVLMGDHTRTAINTSLNSGTVTGICCNIVKSGFPPKYIPDFTWNVETGERYRETKMLEDVHNWMEMKNEKLEEKDKRLLLQHYHHRLNSNE